jgi:hypothetical protein
MNRVAAVQVFLLAILGILLAGCGGSGGSSAIPGPSPTPITFFSGLYEINQASAVSPGTNFTLQGSLLQSGNNLSGVMHATALPCFPFNTDIPVTGKLGIDQTGNFSVDLVYSLPGGQTLSLNTIHPFGHFSFISGTYSLNGAGCAASDQGNVVGQSLSIGGSWMGHFNSSGGVVSQVTNMTLTQTGPDAHGFFSATGTATITGGTCFSNATVDPASVIIGTGSTLIFDNAQPGTTGKTIIHGDLGSAIIGSNFNGTYVSTQGTCSETGTVTFFFG